MVIDFASLGVGALQQLSSILLGNRQERKRRESEGFNEREQLRYALTQESKLGRSQASSSAAASNIFPTAAIQKIGMAESIGRKQLEIKGLKDYIENNISTIDKLFFGGHQKEERRRKEISTLEKEIRAMGGTP